MTMITLRLACAIPQSRSCTAKHKDSRFRDRHPHLAEVRPYVHNAEGDHEHDGRKCQEEREQQPPDESPDSRFPEVMLHDSSSLREIEHRIEDPDVPSDEPWRFTGDDDEGEGRDEAPNPRVRRVPISE